MRTLTIISISVLVLIGTFAWAQPTAHAQIARTKQNTRVMQRKGEKSRVVKRLPPGKKVRVLSRQGRWVKIRVDGSTGWVKSSALSEVKSTAKKSRFGRKGKNGTVTGDRVGADAVKDKGKDGDKPPEKAGDGSDDDDDGGGDGGDDGDDDGDDDDDDDDDAAASGGDDDDDDDDGDDSGAAAASSDADDAGDGDDDTGDGDGEGDEGEAKTSGDADSGSTGASPDVQRTAAKSALRRLGVKPDSVDDAKEGKKSASKRKKAKSDDVESEELAIAMVVKSDRVIMRRKPRKQAKKLDTLYKGAQLTVIKRTTDGKWFLVENSGGDQGWIQASSVSNLGEGYPELMLRTGARAGYTMMSQQFLSDGGGNYELSQYNLNAGAAAVHVMADALYHATPWIVVGADVSYANGFSSPGIAYQDGNGNQTNIAFLMHDLDAAGLVGVDFQHATGLLTYARVGYHYGMFAVQDYNDPNINLAFLPSEILQGLSLGARVEAPRLMGSLGVRVGGDVLLPAVASRAQTKGLTDGQLQSAEGFWGGAQFTYAVAQAINIEAGYRFGYAKTIWYGIAERPTGALNVAFRKDYSHLMSVGVGYAF